MARKEIELGKLYWIESFDEDLVCAVMPLSADYEAFDAVDYKCLIKDRFGLVWGTRMFETKQEAIDFIASRSRWV